MDTTRTAKGARLRRVLSRAGLVLGGAVAGTAAVWLLSTSAASADDLLGGSGLVAPIAAPINGAPLGAAALDATPIAGGSLSAARINSGPITTVLDDATPDQVGTVVGAVLPEPPAPVRQIDVLGHGVHDVVETVTAGSNLPATTELGEPTAPAKLRSLLPGDEEIAPDAVPTADIPQLPPASLTDPVIEPAVEQAAAGERDRVSAPTSFRAVQIAGQQPDLPALPRLPRPMPMPVAPAPVPTGVCSSCGNGGANDDLGVPVTHMWSAGVSGVATSRALRLTSQHVSPPAAGAQPGVTPD